MLKIDNGAVNNTVMSADSFDRSNSIKTKIFIITGADHVIRFKPVARSLDYIVMRS
jgi:hypothetical protein